jgi:hypothetical protein
MPRRTREPAGTVLRRKNGSKSNGRHGPPLLPPASPALQEDVAPCGFKAIVTSALKSFDMSLEVVARSLGALRPKAFLLVTLPQINMFNVLRDQIDPTIAAILTVMTRSRRHSSCCRMRWVTPAQAVESAEPERAGSRLPEPALHLLRQRHLIRREGQVTLTSRAPNRATTK